MLDLHRLRYRASALLAALFALVVCTATPPAAASDVPTIVAHSELEFGVYRGDKVTLETQAEGDKLQIKWVATSTTICRTFTCEIDTGTLSIGVHRLTVVVLNPAGSVTLRYRMRVLEAPIGYKPGAVKPRLVEAGAGMESVSSEDLVVRTLEGRGFSYHKRKLQVVGSLPRALDWEEKLRTQPGSYLQVGRAGAESHVLGPETAVYLAKGDSGRRAIVLQRGEIRSRQLEAASPRWSVLAGDWLQIDGDEKADVLVTKKSVEKDEVTLVVLRGAARVFVKKDDGSEFTGKATYVPQGMTATIRKGDAASLAAALPTSVKAIARSVRATTPFYGRGQRAGEERRGETVLGSRTPATFDEASKLASEAAAARDHVVVVEALAAHETETKKSYRAAMMLGGAYRGLFLHEDAFHLYQAAAKLDRKAPEAPFAIAVLYLSERNWRKAIAFLERAESLGYPDEQLLHYYRGVAHHRLGETVAADAAFQYALWEGGNPAVEESTLRFRRTLSEEGWLDLRFGLGVFYDSNVLRANQETLDGLKAGDPPVEIAKLASAGYLGHGGGSVWAHRSRAARLGLSFDAVKAGYLEPTLKVVEPLDQKLAVKLGFAFGGEADEKPTVALDAEAFAQMFGVGTQRATDRLATGVVLGSPAFWGLGLTLKSELNLDPLPARQDIFDPVLEEVVDIGERSHRRVLYGVRLAPFDGVFQLGLALEVGGAVYRNVYHREEDHALAAYGLGIGWAPSLRHRVGLDVAQKARDFKESPDKRKDSRLDLGLGWMMRYTAALRHELKLESQANKSSRDGSGWKRQVYSYGLNLEL